MGNNGLANCYLRAQRFFIPFRWPLFSFGGLSSIALGRRHTGCPLDLLFQVLPAFNRQTFAINCQLTLINFQHSFKSCAQFAKPRIFAHSTPKKLTFFICNILFVCQVQVFKINQNLYCFHLPQENLPNNVYFYSHLLQKQSILHSIIILY